MRRRMPHGLSPPSKVPLGRRHGQADLLSDNVALHDQLEAIQGPLVNAVIPGGLHLRVREVPSLISWVFCYLAYVAVRTDDESTCDLITYCRLIVREALRHGGQG